MSARTLSRFRLSVAANGKGREQYRQAQFGMRGDIIHLRRETVTRIDRQAHIFGQRLHDLGGEHDFLPWLKKLVSINQISYRVNRRLNSAQKRYHEKRHSKIAELLFTFSDRKLQNLARTMVRIVLIIAKIQGNTNDRDDFDYFCLDTDHLFIGFEYMKRFAFLIFVLCLAGCETAPPIATSRQMLWQQFGTRSLYDLFNAWGPPPADIHLANGTRVVIYTYAAVYDINPYKQSAYGCKASYLAAPSTFEIEDITLDGYARECDRLVRGHIGMTSYISPQGSLFSGAYQGF
jgi:hypothetical protein